MILPLILFLLAAGGIVLFVLYTRQCTDLDELREALKRATNTIEQTRSTRDELVSAVTHEIRTPLTCLAGYTQMMLECELPRERQEMYLNVISRETHRLNSLLTDLLDIQVIQASARLNVRPAQIDTLLRETFEFFRSPASSHRFILDITRPLPEIEVDARRIRQVLTNLVSNAVKYSPQGGEITINAGVQGRDLVVCVKDEGIGIPVEAIPRLFDKFFRVNANGGTGIPGSGLGLALVKECVNAHGGKVWVESRLGQGSDFYFSLPIVPIRNFGSEDEWRTSSPPRVCSKP